MNKERFIQKCVEYISMDAQQMRRMGILLSEDVTNPFDVMSRRNAARIMHEILRICCKEPDEPDVSAAHLLRDLYDCHTCVIHIAQVYVKGIMNAFPIGVETSVLCSKEESHEPLIIERGMTFDGVREISEEEAKEGLDRLFHPKKRVRPDTAIRSTIKFLSLPADVKNVADFIKSHIHDEQYLLLDVRSKEEHETGPIFAGGISFPLDTIKMNPFSVSQNRFLPIVLYCNGASQSSMAAKILLESGYRNVFVLLHENNELFGAM